MISQASSRSRAENERIVGDLYGVSDGNSVGLVLAEMGTRAFTDEALAMLCEIQQEQSREDIHFMNDSDEDDDAH
jgi:hypothetical protein